MNKRTLISNGRLHIGYTIRRFGRFVSRIGNAIEKAGWYVDIDEANPYKEPASYTTPLYWDCECEHDFIHSKTQLTCDACGAHQDEQPDSVLSGSWVRGWMWKRPYRPTGNNPCQQRNRTQP